MARLYFFIRSKNNPSPIYLRCSKGRKLDVFIKTEIFFNPDHWDKKRGRLRNLAQASQKDLINPTLEKLSAYMLDRINADYIHGVCIDKSWARESVRDFFNEKDYETLFFLEYCEKYIQALPSRLRKGKEHPLSRATVLKYKAALQKIKNYETHSGVKLKFKDIGMRFHREFISYLREEEGMNLKTIGVYVNIVKLFARSAKFEGYLINEEINHPNFFAPSSASKSVYLSDDEINRIYQLDFSASERLDNTRDNAIIGLRTGLRVSDFLQLDMSQIKGEYVEVKTKKTAHNVIIPLHPQVKAILKKRGGLPRNISSENFNVYFKEVCQMAGIVEEVEGALMNPQTRRKEEGIFPKYKLVSSHTCRRSFATNLYGKLPNLSIMAITGHKTEKQLLDYIKITPREHAEKLKALWETTEKPEAE